ncbi:YbaY family lipoprotein [Edaphobacter sp. 12200R-103]|uniref:YbaY family lipoprotein n=1 Tax=Edaphobacter sp. 12200R-103 TaxID=2703788 RepID=UPI00138D2A96|nr:YbaY family lipoprotein [Edaphobacter sp. 12200R-103]QHS50463.1 META domain-containing protein [Edaphobacter sp. 12200R-103]
MRVHLPMAVTLAYCLVLSCPAPGLAQGQLAVDGTATYRERMALPPDAVFEATLTDVSRADAAGQAVGQTRIEQPGNPPFHFSIPYDPGQIQPNHIYAVRGRIVEGNRVLFTSSQRYQVLTQGHGSEIGMMMMQRVQGSGQTEPAAVPLRETYWKLEEIAGKAVSPAEQQREAHLIFSAQGGRVSGSGGCNRIAGSYEVSGASLQFRGVASTRMACARGMETESRFLGSLEQVRRWKISGRELQLLGSDDTVLLSLTAQPQ